MEQSAILANNAQIRNIRRLVWTARTFLEAGKWLVVLSRFFRAEKSFVGVSLVSLPGQTCGNVSETGLANLVFDEGFITADQVPSASLSWGSVSSLMIASALSLFPLFA